MDSGKIMVQWNIFCNSQRTGGLHANNLISIAKSPYYNEASLFSEEAKHIRQR